MALMKQHFKCHHGIKILKHVYNIQKYESGSVNITFCSSDQNIRCKNAHHMRDDTTEMCIHF